MPPSTDTSPVADTFDLIALQLLHAEPTRGYDLTLRIQAILDEVLNVNAGSLSPALYGFEQRGLLKAEWNRARIAAAGRSAIGDRVRPPLRRRATRGGERFGGVLVAILRATSRTWFRSTRV